VCWHRLLFSAKESVYKAWFPLTGRWLGFEEAAVDFDPVQRTFTARLLVEGPVVNGTELTSFEGRWLVSNGLVAAAIVISRGLCVFACGVVLKSTAMSSQLNTGAASQKVDGE